MKQFVINLIIPSFNAGKLWNKVLESINKQSYPIGKKILIDSSSTDRTVALAEKYGFETLTISKNEFNHGLSRNLGIKLTDKNCELILFLTQDVVLASNDSIMNLVKSFEINSNIAAAYGRQIPNEDASNIEKFMRSVNYPSQSLLKTIDLKNQLGIKTAFCSNSFAIYQKKRLIEINCFEKTNFGEDMLSAAKLLLNNNAIYYCADAKVFHSHNNSFIKEFTRNYQIGKMHKKNQWLLQEFNSPMQEGNKLIKEIFKTFNIMMVCKFLVYFIVRYSGYLAGKKI